MASAGVVYSLEWSRGVGGYAAIVPNVNTKAGHRWPMRPCAHERHEVVTRHAIDAAERLASINREAFWLRSKITLFVNSYVLFIEEFYNMIQTLC